MHSGFYFFIPFVWKIERCQMENRSTKNALEKAIGLYNRYKLRLRVERECLKI